MSNRIWSIACVGLSLMLLSVGISCRGPGGRAGEEGQPGPYDSPEEAAPPGSLLEGVQRRALASTYAPVVTADSATGVAAANQAQGFELAWSARGVRVTTRSSADLGVFTLGTSGIGRRIGGLAGGADSFTLGACQANGAVGVDGECIRRVERHFAGAVEWFENRPDGVEQGWTLAERPSGDGPLVIDVQVEGAQVTLGEDSQSATLRPSGARSMQLTALGARDATGRRLPAVLVGSPQGFGIEVEDARATYPITVDPLLTAIGWSLESNAAGAYLAWISTEPNLANA